VAFHPDYQDNGLLYTYTSEPVSGLADFAVPLTMPPASPPNHESVVTEWQVPAPGDPTSVVDPTTRRVLLRIEQPQFNHNAGALNFGADDMLYIALGDGGGADDQGPGHVSQGNGQDPSNVLGTILRIDPTGSNSANGEYGLPEDNPFFPGGAGPFGGEAGCADGFCDEIFAFGFRNPFRFSFDKATGDLYAADVGQNDIEEVDVVVAGGNYGWRIKEGSFCFDPNGSDPGFVFDGDCGTEDLIYPVAEYDHDEGIAVIGGFVYRGSAIPPLRGRYVFGDLSRQFSANNGRLFFLSKKNIVKRNRVKTSKIRELRLADQEGLGQSLLGFGQDAMGELYVLANSTGVPFGDTGVVLRIARKH
jgi:glucose/arabinose dehydrogenase